MKPYKREPDGPYWYKFTFQGQLIRRSSGVYNAKDAADIAAAYRTQLLKGEVGLEKPKTIPTFSAAMKEFLDWSETANAAHPNTHKRYVTSSKPLLRYFANTRLDRIESSEVEKYKTWRSRQKKAPAGKSTRPARGAKSLRPATVNRELACLKHLFSHNDNLVPQNPVCKVKFLDEDNLQLRVLSLDEERLYLMAASQPLRDIATLMLEQGMRPDEVCRIRRENVHLDAGYLFNPYGKTKAARRKIWLSETSISILARRLETAKGAYPFPGRVEGKPIVKVNAAHTSAVKRSGIAPCKLYSMRHTFATRYVENGGDIVTLAAILGHSKLNMVLRYAHPSEQHQAESMRKFHEKIAATR